MKRLSLKKSGILMVVTFFCLVMFTSGNCSAKYLTSNYRETSQQTYKCWPIDWFATYFIQEFDKTAPAPGADWLTGNGKNNCGPAITEWTIKATEKGWVVKSFPSSAKIGAIAISVNDAAHWNRLWIVREVYDWGFKGTYIDSKDGEPKEEKISYSWLASASDGYNFKGYIYPERVPQ